MKALTGKMEKAEILCKAIPEILKQNKVYNGDLEIAIRYAEELREILHGLLDYSPNPEKRVDA